MYNKVFQNVRKQGIGKETYVLGILLFKYSIDWVRYFWYYMLGWHGFDFIRFEKIEWPKYTLSISFYILLL